MSIQVFNVLTRQKEEFTPLNPDLVTMYVCGPTVYDYSHIGHAKTYVSFDVIVRYLRFSGYRVRYVQNITDVGHLLDTGEDRIMKGARRERIEPMEVVERFARAYFEVMDALNVTRPDISPRASAHIPEQIEMIKLLIADGYAYEVDGSVYFAVEKFEEYGKLSGSASGRTGRRRAHQRARREASSRRLCAVEEGRAGAHSALAQPVGLGLPRLAHRMLRDGDQVSGRNV